MAIRNELVEELIARRAAANAGGGIEKQEKRRMRGLLNARERIDQLYDQGSFQESGMHVDHDTSGMTHVKMPGDGVVTGIGNVNGRPVAAFSQDFTVSGGSLGRMHSQKICDMMETAANLGIPVVAINDSGGARIQEGVNSLAGYGEIFYRNTLASGVVPQISVILGPCAGGAVYSPALTDFVFVVDNISKMFITGPEVVKTVLGEEISMEDLGGARVQAETAGNAHFFSNSELECFDQIRKLVSYLPDSSRNKAAIIEQKKPKHSYRIDELIPKDSKIPFDVRDIVRSLVDESEFLEVQELFAPNAITGFARINGETVGIVGNQALVLAGVLDIDASDKIARFIRFCDAFSIPLVTLVDIPGYLPGSDQEHAGVIRHGAKVLYAYSEASVPKITVILRKAYGGGYIAMCSNHLRADFVFAWPTAEVAVMGPEGAANIIFRNEIMSADNPDEMRKQKVQEYTEKFANPYVAASNGYVDAVINPEETRAYIAHALKVSRNKSETRPARKHGIPPL